MTREARAAAWDWGEHLAPSQASDLVEVAKAPPPGLNRREDSSMAAAQHRVQDLAAGASQAGMAGSSAAGADSCLPEANRAARCFGRCRVESAVRVGHYSGKAEILHLVMTPGLPPWAWLVRADPGPWPVGRSAL